MSHIFLDLNGDDIANDEPLLKCLLLSYKTISN